MQFINTVSSLTSNCKALEGQLSKLDLLNGSKKTTIECFDAISTLHREVDQELKKNPIDEMYGENYQTFLELTELNDRIESMSSLVVKKIESSSAGPVERNNSKVTRKIIKLSEYLLVNSTDFPLVPSAVERLLAVQESCTSHLEQSQKENQEVQKPKPYTNIPEMYANDDWLTIEALEDVHCFNVLSQLSTIGGSNACGYHAIKNAALALAFFTNMEDKPSLIRLLKEEKFFEDEFFPLINKEALHADLSLAEIESALESLKQSRQTSLQPLAKVLQAYPDSISIVLSNAGKLTNPETSIHHIVSLHKKFEEAGPWVHAIISGHGDHWLTLVLLKTENGECHWFSLNSFKTFRDVTPTHKRQIEGALLNRENSLSQTFHHTFGHFLEIKKGQFNEEGGVAEVDDIQTLLSSFPENFGYLNSAFNFLNQLNLINEPHYKDQLRTMKLLSEFYVRHVASFPEEDRKKIAELQKCLELTRAIEMSVFNSLN